MKFKYIYRREWRLKDVTSAVLTSASVSMAGFCRRTFSKSWVSVSTHSVTVLLGKEAAGNT